MWFKACSKCGGDLRASRDVYGAYIQCVQCGLLRDVPWRVVAGSPAGRAQAERPAA